MRMTEGDRHYIRPTISRGEFDDPLGSILSRAAPVVGIVAVNLALDIAGMWRAERFS